MKMKEFSSRQTKPCTHSVSILGNIFSFAVTDDDILPTIYNCPNDTLLWVATGTTDVNISWTPPTATDNYGTPTLVTTSDPGSAFGVGVTVVNYTATDHVNNVAYCSFTVTIIGKVTETHQSIVT